MVRVLLSEIFKPIVLTPSSWKIFSFILNLLSKNYWCVFLDSLVDCVTCEENGGFVVVGDRKGSMHFIDTVTQRRLFSKVSAGSKSLCIQW